mgnify:CR=1 FL=1
MELAQLKREHDCVEHGDLRDSQGMYEKAIAALIARYAFDRYGSRGYTSALPKCRL